MGMNVKNYNIALEAYNYMKKNDQDSIAWVDVANMYKMLGDYDKSYEILKNNIYNNENYWRLRAEIAEFLEEYNDSIYSYKSLAKICPQSFELCMDNLRRLRLLVQ